MKETIQKIYEDYGQLHEEGCELNDEGGSFDGCTCAVKTMVEEIINEIDDDTAKAVKALYKIVDLNAVVPEIKETATMMLKNYEQEQGAKYVRSLKQEIVELSDLLKERSLCMDCKTPFGSLCEKCAGKE